MGIGTVVYHDIFDGSCEDIAPLSNLLELKLDHVVCGDINELISYVHKKSLVINAITSFNVIEHIYDVAGHF